MAGCPVYIWGPALVAAAPFSRTVRDKVRIFKEDILGIGHSEPVDDEEEPAEPKRWAPIQPHAQPVAEAGDTPND
jgi:hypothetical protein